MDYGGYQSSTLSRKVSRHLCFHSTALPPSKIDPNKTSNKGILDPFCFIPNRVAAKDMAQDLFEELYDFTSAREKKSRLAMLEGIETVLKRRDQGERIGLLHVVDFMLESPHEEVRDTASLIKKSVQGSILELAFSYGENEGLNLTNKVTILEVLGLEMPRAETLSNDYSATQRKWVMLMMSIGKFCELFAYVTERKALLFYLMKVGFLILLKTVVRLSNPCAELVEVLTIP